MDHCEVCAVADGKEPTTNTNVKHAFKIYDRSKEKWYIVHGKSEEEKTRWLQAFEDERKRIALDLQNGFDLAEFRRQATGTYLKTHLEGKNKGMWDVCVWPKGNLENTTCWPNVCLMLDHRLRRWSIIKQTSGLIMIPGAENFIYLVYVSILYHPQFRHRTYFPSTQSYMNITKNR